jgi:hypothetical protein
MSEYYEPTINIVPADQDRENKLVNKALTKYPIPYISGLKLQADIKIGNLTLNTIEYPNPSQDEMSIQVIDPDRPINNYKNPVVWVASDVDGWWNLPDPELPDLPRGWGDGSYDAKGRWASRLLTLAGTFLTQDADDAPKARARLLSATSLVYRGDWLIVNEPIVKGVFVRLSGKPEIATVSPRGRTDFSIGFKAADPIKYEYFDEQEDGYRVEVITPVSGSALATITNEGDTPVPIIVEIPSNFPTPSISSLPTITNTENDTEISIIGGTASDTKLEIDTYNREVLEVTYTDELVTNVANGRAKVSTLIDWIYLEPGDNTIEIQNFPAGSTCTIYYRSGWIG